MANGDVFSEVTMPSWLKLALAILKSQGIATVIALWLVWFVLTSVSGGITQVKDEMSVANKAMTAFVARQDAYDRERGELLKVQLRISRQTCANSAKTEFDRKGCWE